MRLISLFFGVVLVGLFVIGGVSFASGCDGGTLHCDDAAGKTVYNGSFTTCGRTMHGGTICLPCDLGNHKLNQWVGYQCVRYAPTLKGQKTWIGIANFKYMGDKPDHFVYQCDAESSGKTHCRRLAGDAAGME